MVVGDIDPQNYKNNFPSAFCPTARYYEGNTAAHAEGVNAGSDAGRGLPVVCAGSTMFSFNLSSCFYVVQIRLYTTSTFNIQVFSNCNNA